jgi:PAS domain S-box-containing protein
MPATSRDISCYTTSLIATYAVSKGYQTEGLFDGILQYKAQLLNPLEWIDGEIVVKFFDNFVKLSGGDVRVFERVGLEIATNQISHFQLMFLRIAPLSLISKTLPKHTENGISKSFSIHMHIIKNGVIELIFRKTIPEKYSKAICLYNKGCTIALFRRKHLRNLQVTERICAAETATDACIYDITWSPDPPFLTRLKDFFLLRFGSQKAIFSHMEENYSRLQEQYKELAVIKDFYFHIMGNMQEGIVWLDSERRISFVNKGFLAMLRDRTDPATFVGKNFSDYLSESVNRDQIGKLFALCKLSPNTADTWEMLYKANDGSDRLGETTVLWVESAQQKPGYLLSIRDITDKRAIERKLGAVENRYRTLYENSPAIIIGVDLDGNILYANPAMVEQSEYGEDELKHMNYAELVVPEGSTADAKGILTQRIGKVGMQEMHYRSKSGQWKSVATATFPLYDDKWKAIGLGAIGVDVTETKRLNEILIQTQRMDLLGQMAGGLAHDFKNLLAVISGYSNLITQVSTEKKVQEFADNIQIANERAAGLVKNLLTFSRGDSAKNEPFVLNDVVEEVKKLLPPILGRQIRLKPDLSARQYRVTGDSGKIHQCVLNLCINARDAMAEKNGGQLTLRLKDDDQSGWCVIEVEDNGPGIPPDIIDRIFDPFFSTKKKQEGTGLGLSVVYGVAKSHGGEIIVDSRPGEGATFKIRLPLLAEAGAVAQEGATLTAMVVEDDLVARNFCVQILAHQGYKVHPFATISESSTWLAATPHGQTIALFPAVQVQKAVELLVDHKELLPIWICDDEGKSLPQEHPHLKRPFPPAALIETVKSIERKKGQL